MIKKYSLIIGLGLIIGASGLASCSKTTDFLGVWTSTTPEDITASVPAASSATSLVSISFVEGTGNKDGGSVALTSIINVNQPVSGSPISMNQPYEVNVAATASLGGTWIYEEGSDDDLLLSLDLSTLKVNVDNNGVSFTQNMLTGAQQPQIDSLTTVTAELWKNQLTQAMTKEFSRFKKLDDVKVHKGQVLTFEIQNPELTLQMRKTE